MSKEYDLQERLIAFACRMMEIAEALPNSKSGNYLSGQLVRSANSSSFNYAEAQSAESRKDFIHKLSLVLKELKECRTAQKTILMRKMVQPPDQLYTDLDETEQLIAIIGKSISTAQKNLLDGKVKSSRRPP